MSEFETFDHLKSKGKGRPFETADGVEVADGSINEEMTVSDVPPDCHEIRIITGRNGLVACSKVFIDGEEVKGLTRFEVVGTLGGRWEISTSQSIGGGS